MNGTGSEKVVATVSMTRDELNQEGSLAAARAQATAALNIAALRLSKVLDPESIVLEDPPVMGADGYTEVQSLRYTGYAYPLNMLPHPPVA